MLHFKFKKDENNEEVNLDNIFKIKREVIIITNFKNNNKP